MSDATFQTFLTSGLFVLTAAIGYLAWTAWRWMDRISDTEKIALAGIGHELEANLKRMTTELRGIAEGTVTQDIQLVPIVHAQLDAFLARPNEFDRKSLTMMRANYNELSAHKNSLRVAMREQDDLSVPANIAADAVISSIATLYLWMVHKGRMPEDAASTRSWHVRDWMKANRFDADLLPGLHLRDQVVGRLRALGMTLTPKPLTYTAHEFYSMQYDRKADPNAPFWKRKKKAVPVPVLETDVEAEAGAETIEDLPLEAHAEVETVQEVQAEPVPEPQPEPEPDVQAEPLVETQAQPEPEPSPEPEIETEPAAAAPVETDGVEPAAEPTPDQKPPSSGSVH